jgi:hypothetical protein
VISVSLFRRYNIDSERKPKMTAIRFTINTLITTAFVFTLAVTAQAQSRVFVSGLGDDLSPCSRTSPCRNFQRGHDAVAPGGEVVALDSAGYGPVTITKSVTITGEGVYAGITASSGNGVTIATAGITVILRSLTIEGLGTGDKGINATDFTVLHIENCIVNRFSGEGIRVLPSGAGTRKVFIKDSIFKNNGSIGIVLDGIAAPLTATVEGTRTENNNAGLLTRGSATVTVRGCLASGNLGSGFGLDQGVTAVLNIESSVASNNGLGIVTGMGATVRVSDSMVTNNTGFGYSNSTFISGTFETRANNTVAGNNGGGAQTSGSITPITAF